MNVATKATAFEAALLTKSPTLPGVSDLPDDGHALVPPAGAASLLQHGPRSGPVVARRVDAGANLEPSGVPMAPPMIPGEACEGHRFGLDNHSQQIARVPSDKHAHWGSSALGPLPVQRASNCSFIRRLVILARQIQPTSALPSNLSTLRVTRTKLHVWDPP
jgi:hypothetical protein